MATTSNDCIRHRNVVIIGKSGAGKSTIANQIVGETSFKVASTLDAVTEVISHEEVTLVHDGVKYLVTVVDTIGLFDKKFKNKDTIGKIRDYLRGIFPSGISLILFVMADGRMTAEEKECLETMSDMVHDDVSPWRHLR